MTASYKSTKVSLLNRKDRLVVRLLLQSKVKVALFSSLFAIPLVASSGFAYWLYNQNQVLANSTREVVNELEILNKEVEVLSRRAGLPRVKPDGLTPQTSKGQGGISAPIAAEEQLEIVKSKIPGIVSRLHTETKPALDKTLKKEQVIALATPSGNPTKGSFEVSSDFGIRPNPFGWGGYERHDGIDILGDYDTPIYATHSGKAERVHYDSGYGNFVLVKSDLGYETVYAHLSKFAIQPNSPVKKGQLVGYMGSTGRSTGTHLHYSVYHKGKAVDPKGFMTPGWTYSEAFN